MEGLEHFEEMEALMRTSFKIDNKIYRERIKAERYYNKIKAQVERFEKKMAVSKQTFLSANRTLSELDELLDKKIRAKLEYDLLDAYVNGSKCQVHTMFNRKRKYIKDRELKNA